MSKGIGGHQSARSVKTEWLTPPEIVRSLGAFDLDPCSPEVRPWDTAKRHYWKDGLSLPWDGRIWLNPPYGPWLELWLSRLAGHGNGIAIIFARTETRLWRRWVWESADAVLFLYARPHFYHVDGTRADGNSGGPIAMVAYGAANVKSLRDSGIAGYLVADWSLQ